MEPTSLNPSNSGTVVWCGDKLFASVDAMPVSDGQDVTLTLDQVIAAGVRALLQEAGLAATLATERGQEAAADFGREYQALDRAANDYSFHVSRLLDTESTLAMPWNARRMVTLQAVGQFLEKLRVCRDAEGHALAEEALGDLKVPLVRSLAADAGVDQQQTGVYGKFTVNRVDGRDAPGGDRHGADYFVLDVTHDRFAKPALAAYAQACASKYGQLAQDLITRYDLGDPT